MTNRIRQLDPGILLLDRYHIVKPLAGSYSGNVYLARDFKLSYQIRAIKETVIDFKGEKDRIKTIERLNQESEIIANLDHPSIPKIYDFFFIENRFYIVMNYVDGIDLQDLVKVYGESIGERTVVEWSIKLCDMFAYLHSQQPSIYFSDILMQDIMVDRKRDCIVVTGLTSLQKRHRHRKQQNDYSDMFAVGSLMFRLLTGVDPNVKIGNNRPQRVNANLSDGINHLVRKSLEPHVAYRFTSFAQMRQALEVHTKSLEEQYRKISAPLPSIPQPSLGPFCQNCGNSVGSDSLFCNNCGYRIVQRSVVGASATDPSQQPLSTLIKESQSESADQSPTEDFTEISCANCSTLLRSSAKYCNKCGAAQFESRSADLDAVSSVSPSVIEINEPPTQDEPSLSLDDNAPVIDPVDDPVNDPVEESSPLTLTIETLETAPSFADSLTSTTQKHRYPTMENAPVRSSAQASLNNEEPAVEQFPPMFIPTAPAAPSNTKTLPSMRQPSASQSRHKKNWILKLAKLFKRTDPDPSKFETVVRKPPNLFEMNEAAIIRRHTDISFPAKAPAEKTYNLRVQIAPAEIVLSDGEAKETSKSHKLDMLMELEVPKPLDVDQPTPPIRIKVSVSAENFEIESESNAEIIVPLKGKPPEAIFKLKGIEAGSGRIMVDFTQDGKPVGSVDLYSEIASAGQKESEEEVRAVGELGFHIRPETPPDLIIKVFESRYGDHPGKLHFVVSSTNPVLQDLPMMDGDLGTTELRSEVAAWVEEQLQALAKISRRSDLSAEEVAKTLRKIGFKLFDQLLPKSLQDLYWPIRKRGVRTVLILSDEPHIPWELIKPYRMNPVTGTVEDEDGFWGEAFAMTHWLRGRPPVGKLSLRRAVVVAASGELPSLHKQSPHVAKKRRRNSIGDEREQLEKAITFSGHTVEKITKVEEEIYMLSSLNIGDVELNVLPPQRKALLSAFEKGGFGLLHLASHRAFGGTETADASAVMMEDGPFSVSELSSDMTEAIMKSSPLVFFNSCSSGRLGFSLTKLGAWGARFVQLGCGGFVGSLWPVTEEAALSFAKEFYIAILDGMPIGEAMIRARLLVRLLHPSDPAWLAYSCFADPTAKIVF